MKEQDLEERVVLIDIKLTRSLVLVVSVLALIAAAILYLALTGDGAQAAPQAVPLAVPDAPSDGMRQFYLGGAVGGAGVKTACASGYHAAALWEIADPSNLKYNTTHGLPAQDSGSGPPTIYWGWVRTGYANDTSNTPGHANCNSWITSNYNVNGTIAKLPDNWTAGTEDLGVWVLDIAECSYIAHVWCIQD